MTPLTLSLVLFVATYIHVLGKAFQQRNVTGDHDLAVIPTSYFQSLAVLEISIIGVNVINNGLGWETLWLMFVVGTAGWMATLTAMRLHRRVFS